MLPPHAWPQLPFRTASLQAEGVRSSLDVGEAQGLSADHRTYMRGHSGPLTLLLPSAMRGRLDAYVGRAGEVLFPGIIVLALAALGIVHRARRTEHVAPSTMFWFYLALMCVAVWASLGPRAGLYVWLADVIPFMSFLRAPVRFGVLVLMCVAVFAGWGMAALTRNGRRAAGGPCPADAGGS